MKKWAPLLCLFALLFSACGERAVAPTTAVQITTEAPMTTEMPTTRVLQPLPEGCRWITYDEAAQKLGKALKEYQERELREKEPPKGITVYGKEASLILRNEATGKETVIARRHNSDMFWPEVETIINGRYIIWRDNITPRSVEYGIYDIKRGREIKLDAGGYIWSIFKGFLYVIPWMPETWPTIYRISLRDLDSVDHLEHGKNLLEGLIGGGWENSKQNSEMLSPDCRYYAVYAAGTGAFIYDLSVPKLVMHMSEDMVPNHEYHDYLDMRFPDNNTLYFYNDPTLEITLP
ncbi:MAG: hypothetical protein LBB75_02890 [Oscillospiraceae bacterium]|jgi:hypothetical protein|nr:hypothetical protein [Oscillospiraceae bacterium]